MLTITDYLLYAFNGCDPHIIVDSVFVVPILFLVIFLFPSLITLNYPYKNLHDHGINVMVGGGSRILWWFSKIVYIIVWTFLYFGLLYGVLCLLCLLTGNRISMEISWQITENIIQHTFASVPSSTDLFYQLIIIPILVSASINILQMFLSLLTGCEYAFMVVVALYLASVYFPNHILPGTYAVLAQSLLIEGGTCNSAYALAVCSATVVIAIVGGCFRIRRYDIY